MTLKSTFYSEMVKYCFVDLRVKCCLDDSNCCWLYKFLDGDMLLLWHGYMLPWPLSLFTILIWVNVASMTLTSNCYWLYKFWDGYMLPQWPLLKFNCYRLYQFKDGYMLPRWPSNVRLLLTLQIVGWYVMCKYLIKIFIWYG
jgi:hypothetical protein